MKHSCLNGSYVPQAEDAQSADFGRNGTLAMEQLDAALKDLGSGVYSVPIALQEKGPKRADWQKLRLDEAELRVEFGGATLNRGRILGAASGGLVDCDLDCEEAVAMAAEFLPATEEIHGRQSRPDSHRWYRVDEQAFKTIQFRDENNAMIVELRGDGGQTVVPPSVHPSGEKLFWKTMKGPAVVGAQALVAACSRLAAAVLLLRYYPTQGGRHGFALALAGTLLQGGLPAVDAEHLIQAVAYAAGDEETEARVRNVQTTVERMERSELVEGRGKLRELIGANGVAVLKHLDKWLQLRTSGHPRQDNTTFLKRLADAARENPKAVLCDWLGDRGLIEQLAAVFVADRLSFESLIVGLHKGDVSKGDLKRLEASVKAVAKTVKRRAEDATSPFEMNDEGIFENGERGRRQLANFSAKIVKEVIEDDGVDQERKVQIEARLAGQVVSAYAAMSEFGSGNWIAGQLGIGAVLSPGISVRDQVRYVIQSHSGVVPQEHIFTHIGWRKISGDWYYLHGGGAIARFGGVEGVKVRLPRNLELFRLPVPSDDATSNLDAVAKSLELANVAAPEVIYPLMGALFRSVVDKCDFAIHLTGQTGSGKSELAALIQQHFGAEMHARSLPASWTSTANSLESTAFTIKDAILVVDDFCPTGTKSDIDKLNQAAERLIRSQGNNCARQRLQSNLELRPPRPPRGLVLSTGEDIFRGHSLRARTVILEVAPNAINFERLTACQSAARTEAYATTMSLFLKWLAPHLDEVRFELVEAVKRARGAESSGAYHRRTGDNGTHLLFGWNLFIRFAREIGGIDGGRAEELRLCGARAIDIAISGQGKLQREADPIDRWLELLRAAFASRRCQLQDPSGDWKPWLVRWGWKDDRNHVRNEHALHIGWVTDDEDVYLLPDATYQVVNRMAQEQQEVFPWSLDTLKKRLRDRGVLRSTDATRQRITVRKMLGETRCDVLHFAAETVAPSEFEPRLAIPTTE